MSSIRYALVSSLACPGLWFNQLSLVDDATEEFMAGLSCTAKTETSEKVKIHLITSQGVRKGLGNPGKSLNFKNLFSRPGKSYNSDAYPGKYWKSELGFIF